MRLIANQKKLTNRNAATLFLIVIILPVLLMLAAIAINVAHIESVRVETQVAIDSATRAANREFLLTQDKAKALAAAREMSSRNPINGFVIPIEANDLVFGTGQRTKPGDYYSFTASSTRNGNAVQITTNSFAEGENGIEPVFSLLPMEKIRPRMTATSAQGVIDVALVVDRSGSMAYAADEVANFPPFPAAASSGWDFGQAVPANARWLDTVAGIRVFIDVLRNSDTDENLSLTIYDQSPTTILNLSNNYSPLTAELNKISNAFEAGRTNIGDGIIEGAKTLVDPAYGRVDASKVIVLLTDGVHNTGKDPLDAAEIISQSGISVFTVTFSDEADQAGMKAVARRCRGKHFHAQNATQLREAFRDIARSMPLMITE